MEEKKKSTSGLLGFLGARGRLWLLLGGLVCGIFLIVLGSSMQSTEKGGAAHADAESLEALQSYEQQLEKEIAALCDEVAGVGQSEVMVRLKSGTRVLYAADENGKPVLVGSGSDEQALPSTVLLPEIAGVAVVCRGGSSPSVQQTLTDLVCTALGIPSSRVIIAGK